MTQPSQPVIPLPPNFPIEWEDPNDASLFWAQLQNYYPTPLVPMGFELVHKPTVEAGNKRLRSLGVPVSPLTRHFNGFVYNTMLPPSEADASLVIPAEAYTQEKLDAIVTDLAERWRLEWLPAVEEHLSFWRSFPVETADADALVAHFRETVHRVEQIEQVHFDVVLAVVLAMDLFQKTIADLFADESDVEAHSLLAGFESKGTKGSRALWGLSRRALSEPTVKQILMETPADAVLDALKKAECTAFVAAFDAFLEVYGYQGNKNYMDEPTLAEAPEMVIQSLQGYMNQPDRDLEAEARAIVDKREQGVAAVRNKLSMYPRPIVDHFEFLLKAAQEATWLREEHAHLLDLPLNHYLRRLLLAIGQRLQAAGALDVSEDIFFLTPDEACISMSAQPPLPRHELARQRRAVHEKFAKFNPPLMFGPIPMVVPAPHPIMDAIMHNAGDPSQSSMKPGQIKGVAGSPGVVKGTAKVLHSINEAGKLGRGDILVAPMTVPAWTLLFANISGLVTATGGALSHAAVVAREFGVPAVVGAVGATSLIHDGQKIEVDGTAGVVTLEV